MAAAGEQRAYRALMDLDSRYGPQDCDKPVGYLVVPEQLTIEEWVVRYSPKDEPERLQSRRNKTTSGAASSSLRRRRLKWRTLEPLSLFTRTGTIVRGGSTNVAPYVGCGVGD